MQIQLLRHATLLIAYAGRRILVDPMLGEVGSYGPIANTPNQVPNPLVPLPVPISAILDRLDAVIVTHLHRDHWDQTAIETIPKHLPLYCQPGDELTFTNQGFTDVRPVEQEGSFGPILMSRTGGQHGTGEIGKAMGKVSGFVLRAPGEPVLYLAGDTIWCDEVNEALRVHRPDVTVVNSGAARFLSGDPITMTPADIAEVAQRSPAVVAVHLEAINHCLLTRQDLIAAIPAIFVPADGEAITFGTPQA